MSTALSPAAYGRHLAETVRITDEQALEFARIFLAGEQLAA